MNLLKKLLIGTLLLVGVVLEIAAMIVTILVPIWILVLVLEQARRSSTTISLVETLLVVGVVVVALLLLRRSVPTRVELTQDTLIVHLRGIDRILAFKSRVEVPLADVKGVEPYPLFIESVRRQLKERIGKWRFLTLSIRAPGTAVPWVVGAGSFYIVGWRTFKRVFLAFHKSDKAIGIWLSGARYDWLLIEVRNPSATMSAIQEAIGEK